MLYLKIFICLILLKFSFERRARCYMIPDKDSTISGEVRFEQENEKSPVNIQVKVYGAKSVHGFHIHEKALVGNDCMSTGGHFNPFNMKHGGPESDERHMGDLGNIQTKDGNAILYDFTNDKISLYGDNTIIGRSCVTHAFQDDLGKGGDEKSLITGNSGPRLACGIVQSYDPVYSIIFGVTTLFVGIGLSFYYFFCFRKSHDINSNLVEGEVRPA
jgi:Cu-Zn family superoxide dismutase